MIKKCKEFIKKHSELSLALLKLIIFAIVLFVCFGVILGIKTMNADYMRPGLKYRDNVVYSRFEDKYMLRDLVVYEYNGEIYFGRIVGMTGSTMKTNENGNVFTNNNLVYEENINYTSKRSMEVELTLKDDEYFILCDDRSQNFDSRQFGAISKNQIKGKVIIVLRRYEI